jgi:hypothetical protein
MKARYTLKEANQLLRLVRSIAAEVVDRRAERRRLFRLREDLETARTPEGLTSSIADVEARLFDEKLALELALRELEQLGLTVLRLHPLTIHIPGRTQRGPIVFCWQEGENSIGHGHAPGEEEDPRRPLRVRAVQAEPGV